MIERMDDGRRLVGAEFLSWAFGAEGIAWRKLMRLARQQQTEHFRRVVRDMQGYLITGPQEVDDGD